ncbi:hypothetical protein PsYK624_141130 [Phanerochaete sordida]|uniref:F-box domain-containing protein n=1 Tax=Phanerochaete sordida TaxID=48140 RepID=A0A9P3GNC0_9APHY|nr:hypothetical protein PsYK624_141130 [Phanerochaete sordida]
MHRCWTVTELVREIVQHLPDCYTLGDRPFFFHLALVSRVFYEPAMDKLWAHLFNGIGPLLFCLPEGTVTRQGVTGYNFTITRPPVGDEWARFVHHARRVREVKLFPITRVRGIAHDVARETSWLEAIRKNGPRPVLPQLRRLVVRMVAGAPRSAEIFLHDSLNAVSMEYARPSAETKGILQKLEGMGSLSHLLLHQDWYICHLTNPGIEGVYAQLSKTVSTLGRLRILDGGFHALSPDALAHLSHIPDLKTLMLYVMSSNIVFKSRNMGKFARLTELHILFGFDASPVDWAGFIRSLRSAPLHTLHISSTELPTGVLSSTNQFLPFFEALGLFTSLRDCTISLGPEDMEWGGDYLTSTALDALLQVRGLRKVTLYNCPVSFASPLAEKMAKAWPSLSTLCLCNDQVLAEGRGHLGVPLADLVHFARCCPQLTTLAASLAPVPPLWTWDDAGASVPPSDAQELNVQYAEVAPAAAPAVARFLDRYFPNAPLVHLYGTDGDPDLVGELPERGKTLELVKELRVARK